MTIYKAIVTLGKDGWNETIKELNVTETEKSFVGEGRRIGKEKLMRVDTIFLESHKHYIYFAYCLEGQQQQALYSLKEKILEMASKHLQEINAVQKHI